MAFVWPSEVLPLVVSRFEAALETATAMHQLPAAMSTLAMCTRPMLLAQWGTPDANTGQVGFGFWGLRGTCWGFRCPS